jgi:hypothetical protein
MSDSTAAFKTRLRAHFAKGDTSWSGASAALGAAELAEDLAPREITPQEKLALLEEAIDETNSTLSASALPLAQAATATPPPSYPQVTSHKESPQYVPEVVAAAPMPEVAPPAPEVVPEMAQVEAAPATEVVEQVGEIGAELGEVPPEISEYIQRVEDHQVTAPVEVVMATDQLPSLTAQQRIPQPVVILPIDQADEKSGEHKNPTHSLRWLVEWSRKLMKMFAGQAVYKY